MPHIRIRNALKEKAYDKSSVVIFEHNTVKLEEKDTFASWKETGKVRGKNKNGIEIINNYEAIIYCYDMANYTNLGAWQIVKLELDN